MSGIDFDQTIVLVVLIALFGSIVSTTAGFGFSLVAAPPLLLMYEPTRVAVVLLAITIATRWMLLLDTWRSTQTRLIWKMLPGAYVGIALGLGVVQIADPTSIKVLASIVVIVAAVAMYQGWHPAQIDSARAPTVAGLLSGILSPTTGMDGTPVALLLTGRGFGIAEFRATITVYYYLITPVALGLLALSGRVGRGELVIAAAMVPSVVLGTAIGTLLARRLSVEWFRTIVFVLLLLGGVMGLVTALIR